MKQFLLDLWSVLLWFFGTPNQMETCEDDSLCVITSSEAAAPETFYGHVGYLGLSEFDTLAERRRHRAEQSGGVV